MTVRIDAPLWPAHGTVWCHLVSDESLDELHAFAQRVGLGRRAFDLDHYDVPGERIADCVAAGAVQTERRELLRLLTASGLRVSGRNRPAAKRAHLQTRWDTLLPSAPEVGTELLDRWHEPHRKYHTPAHLTHALDSLGVLVEVAPRTAELAIWFHDAVHTGTAGTDELQSANLAQHLLSSADARLSPGEVAEVARLVLVTATHAPTPDDDLGALVCDADLAVLAGAPDRYSRYVAAVRAEYAHVPDAEFFPARNAVLATFLDRAAIFQTSIGVQRWEQTARANLTAEIALNRQWG